MCGLAILVVLVYHNLVSLGWDQGHDAIHFPDFLGCLLVGAVRPSRTWWGAGIGEHWTHFETRENFLVGTRLVLRGLPSVVVGCCGQDDGYVPREVLLFACA